MYRVAARRASVVWTTRSSNHQMVGGRTSITSSRGFSTLELESRENVQSSTHDISGELGQGQNDRLRKVNIHNQSFSKGVFNDGFSCPPIVKGAVFREWCKAVAADTLRMAIDDANAKMKSKAGVIGRAEGGELGMKLDSGYLSPHFVTDQKNQKCELEDPLILIHEKKIHNAEAIEKLLQLASKKQRPFLIVAEDVGSDALGCLVLNKLSSGVKVCAVKAPGFGDKRKASLQNLASIAGGEIISKEDDLHNVVADTLGTCKKVIISKNDTVIVEGAGAKKPTKEKSAEEEDNEMVKTHREESELLLKHLLEEEEKFERRQSERLSITFKKFIKQFPVKKRKARKIAS